MENIQEHLKDISEIRNLMEKNSKFLSLSGLSGISAGVCGLIGMAIAWYALDYDPAGRVVYGVPSMGMELFFVVLAVSVLAAALGSALFFSRRMAQRRKLPLWNATAKRMLVDLAVPLLAGGILCVIQLQQGYYDLLPGTTLVFYGLGLFTAHRHTITEVRWLAICEIGLGLLAATLPGFGLIFWGIGFGLLHIVYGTIMYLKYEK